MKKIGIITICDYTNYGNRLQNYATQEVLKSLGFEVETIVNNPAVVKSGTELKRGSLGRIKNLSIDKLFLKILEKTRKKFYKKYEEARKISFKRFTKEYIKETDYVLTRDYIPENIGNCYDYFVVGSDQVWNPLFRQGFPIDFLTFAPKNKRIAFSPSFGISTIPQEYIENYKLWLSEIEYLSVREQTGAKIIKDLTNRDVEVLVDPTLLLSKEKWLEISRESISKPKQEYLLTYFLGGISKRREKIIKRIAETRNLKIVNLASKKDLKRYTADPAEFIDYINSSTVFLTDSFHGCVFSILLGKPFIVFQREDKLPSMSSRIDNLLTKFRLEKRKIENIKFSSELFDIDYSHVPEILEKERKKSINYLKKSLGIECNFQNKQFKSE